MSTSRSPSQPAWEQMWRLVPGWIRARDAENRPAEKDQLLKGLIRALGVGVDASIKAAG